MMDKIRKILYEISELLEIFVAFLVVAGVVVATLTLLPELADYWNNRFEPEVFHGFLGAVFNVVIGLEFAKMLCKPSSANIIEVLIFLISRHMILQTTTPGEDLLSVISIGILFLFRRFMLATKPDKNHRVPAFFRALRMVQSKEFQEAVRQAEEKDENP